MTSWDWAGQGGDGCGGGGVGGAAADREQTGGFVCVTGAKESWRG